MTGSARQTRLRAFLDQVWSSDDPEAARDFLADTYTIHLDTGDPWEGRTLDRDEFVERVRISRTDAPDQIFSVVDMIENGDKIAVTWTWCGTHSAEIAGIPATGKPITMTGATIYYFAGDLICGHWQIADKLGVVQQLQRP